MSGKKKYVITIEEMISQDFEVVAKSDEEAERIAIEKYNNGEFVLCPGNLVSKQIQMHNISDDYWIDWVEF